MYNAWRGEGKEADRPSPEQRDPAAARPLLRDQLTAGTTDCKRCDRESDFLTHCECERASIPQAPMDLPSILLWHSQALCATDEMIVIEQRSFWGFPNNLQSLCKALTASSTCPQLQTESSNLWINLVAFAQHADWMLTQCPVYTSVWYRTAHPGNLVTDLFPFPEPFSWILLCFGRVSDTVAQTGLELLILLSLPLKCWDCRHAPRPTPHSQISDLSV